MIPQLQAWGSLLSLLRGISHELQPGMDVEKIKAKISTVGLTGNLVIKKGMYPAEFLSRVFEDSMTENEFV